MANYAKRKLNVIIKSGSYRFIKANEDNKELVSKTSYINSYMLLIYISNYILQFKTTTTTKEQNKNKNKQTNLKFMKLWLVLYYITWKRLNNRRTALWEDLIMYICLGVNNCPCSTCTTALHIRTFDMQICVDRLIEMQLLCWLKAADLNGYSG